MYKITKRGLINYLVDCKGYSEAEAKTITSVYGTSYLSQEEMRECILFNN